MRQLGRSKILEAFGLAASLLASHPVPLFAQRPSPPILGETAFIAAAQNDAEEARQPIDPKRYSDFIDRLSADIAREWPSLGSRVVIMKLFPSMDGKQVLADLGSAIGGKLETPLSISLGSRASGAQTVLDILNLYLSKEPASLAGQAISPGPDTSADYYFCVAFPLVQNTTGYEFTKELVKDDVIAPAGTAFSQFWQIAHETGHCLMGKPSDPEETFLMQNLRFEAGTEVFAYLLLRRDNFQDLDQETERWATIRSAEAGVFGNFDHRATSILRRVMRETKNRDFSGTTLPELARLASDYGREAVQEFCPHLYRQKNPLVARENSSYIENLWKTQVADKEIYETFKFIQDVDEGKKPQLDFMPLRRAKLLVITTNDLDAITGKTHPMDKVLFDLRAQYSEIFRRALDELIGDARTRDASLWKRNALTLVPH